MLVATWNVNGIRAREAQFLEWVARDRPDVICLQEIKAKTEQLSLALGTLSDYWSYWHGAGGYSGVSLHLKKTRFPEPPIFSHPAFDRETRIVEATAGGVVFTSVYIPNGGKDYPAKLAFLDEMAAYTAAVAARGAAHVLCGDLNVARADADVHPSQRDPSVIGQRAEERERFERMFAPGLVDVGRAAHPGDERFFTWWPYWRQARQRNIGWRIDYILASAPLAARVSECKVLADVGTSDHAPLVATFG